MSRVRVMSTAGVAAAAALTLAGCGAATPASHPTAPKPSRSAAVVATPSSSPADAPAKGRTLFADASTIDPCSLVDVHDLPASLHAVAEPADSFDSCSVRVTAGGAGKVVLVVGPVDFDIDDPTADQVTSLGHAITLNRQTTPDAGHCRGYADFADGYLLELHATGARTAGPPVCSVLEPVARAVVTRIVSGGIKHLTYPSGSVGSVDPCDLLPDSALAHTGLGALRGSGSDVEAHNCQWQFGSGTVDTVVLQFRLGARPHAGAKDQPTTIAGRPTVLSAFHNTDGTISCDTDTGLRAHRGGEVEIAEVVATSSTVSRACKAARTVAAAALPKLPHA